MAATTACIDTGTNDAARVSTNTGGIGEEDVHASRSCDAGEGFGEPVLLDRRLPGALAVVAVEVNDEEAAARDIHAPVASCKFSGEGGDLFRVTAGVVHSMGCDRPFAPLLERMKKPATRDTELGDGVGAGHDVRWKSLSGSRGDGSRSRHAYRAG